MVDFVLMRSAWNGTNMVKVLEMRERLPALTGCKENTRRLKVDARCLYG